jgi:hypothetical protein
MPISRKVFLAQLSGSWLLVSGCGGGGTDGSPAPAPPPPAAGGGCTATILANHGHVLVIPAADLDSTTGKTYDIRGSADHTHGVTFSAAQLAQLKAGQAVSVTTSSTLAHTHTISETCA